MGTRYLTDLADVVRGAGVDVVETDGWQTRARGSGGYDGDRPWCVMWHHTASNTTPGNDVSYIINADDAPIANLYVARDGTVWICAAGAANTNGKGGPLPTSRGVVPLDAMNTHAIGIEMANDGVGQPWPQAQVDAAFAVSTALCRHYGLADTDVCTHAGWVEPSCPGRKIDPARADAVEGPWRPSAVNTNGTWSVDDLRAEHTRRSAPPPTPQPTPPPKGDDDMPIGSFLFQSSGRGTMRHVDSQEYPAYPGAVFYSEPGCMFYSWLTDETALADKRDMLANAGYPTTIQGPVDNCHAFGFLVGPVPTMQ